MVSVWFTRLHNHGEVSTVCDDLGVMSSAGVGSLCFLKTNVTAPVYQEILEHFMLPSADQLFKDADLIFQQDLAHAHTAKSTKNWLNDHGVGVLEWPANSPDLNPIEPLPSIEYIYSKLTYFPEGQQFTILFIFLFFCLMKYSNLLR